MRRAPATSALLAALAIGCRDRPRPPPPVASAPAPLTAHAAPAPSVACAPRTAEKLGIPFVRVCPRGEEGFWITAVPMGCSAGDHDTVRCPLVTPLAHPVRADAGPRRPVHAAVVDKSSAQRMCFMRMGGRMPSRAERSKARALLGLSTVLVTESEASAERFHFAELPEWVVEEALPACESPAEPGPECVFGWFPSGSRSPAVRWSNLRACEARHAAKAPEAVQVAALGAGCGALGWSWGVDAGDAPRPLPCALRSPARDDRGAEEAAVFTFACAPPAAAPHPETEDKDTAAYRCVVPEAALGTFDLAGW